jgi:hypothetical protein
VSAPRPDESDSLQVFVIEIDGRPTLAFEASDLAEAQEISGDADLRTDLVALTSDGAPVCAPGSTLVARAAAQDEIAAFQHAVGHAPASDQPTMAFLIKIDGVVVVTVGPDQA